MNLLETVLSSGGNQVVNNLASQFGISSDQATAAASTLLPALAGGIKEKLEAGDTGISDLLTKGSLSAYADPSTLSSVGAIQQGKTLVSSILGSGAATSLISTVAEKAGISEGTVKSMLPVVATFLAGCISKNVASGGNLNDVIGQFASAGHGGVLGALKSLTAKVLG
jgi:hypothetical protein